MKLINHLKNEPDTFRNNEQKSEVSRSDREYPDDRDEAHNLTPYPVTFHPNILPPTEFMALGLYGRC